MMLLLALEVDASRGRADLIVEARGNQLVQVMVDGRRINNRPRRSVKVSDIRSGDHDVTIRVMGRSRRSMRVIRKRVYLRRGSVTRVTLNDQRRNGRVHLSFRVAPLRSRVYASVTLSSNQDRDRDRYTYDDRDNYRDFDERYDSRGMSDEELRTVLNEMSRLEFDSDKLELALEAIEGQELYSEDLIKMIRLLKFENNRNKLARQAKDQIIDRDRFDDVEEAIKDREYRYDNDGGQRQNDVDGQMRRRGN